MFNLIQDDWQIQIVTLAIFLKRIYILCSIKDYRAY